MVSNNGKRKEHKPRKRQAEKKKRAAIGHKITRGVHPVSITGCGTKDVKDMEMVAIHCKDPLQKRLEFSIAFFPEQLPSLIKGLMKVQAIFDEPE